MLQRLNVQNFALIENAELFFDGGYSVITGETGSGKSILLGALRLILGERADYNVIRNKELKTVVEAQFQLGEAQIKPFFEQHDLDFSVETIIRREINAQGKSRAFINDTPVQLVVLKELTEKLIHIHSQHHTLDLKDRGFQLALVDALSSSDALRKDCAQAFKIWKDARKQLDEYSTNLALAQREMEFNQFLLDELTALNLTQINYHELEEEVRRGEQAEDIIRSFSAITSLVHSEDGLTAQLHRIAKLNHYGDQELQHLLERLNSIRIELDDIGATAEDAVDLVSISPEELVTKTLQLDGFNSALRKHQVQDQEQLIAVFETLNKKVQAVETGTDEIQQLEAKVVQLERNYQAIATQLSEQRRAYASEIEQNIGSWLHKLKLEDAKVSLVFSKLEEATRFGWDECIIHFSANKGMAPQPVDKVASGGELSRLMLVIQYLLSGKKTLPTVIFDEIDTGVSGEVAQRIGELLQLMGESMQLMAITHLPQVAGKGAHHFKVLKRENQLGETITEIRGLNHEQRVEEIARLMSGAEINDSALETARNLMN
jgi:DNA repair protein RecN (Recombination protein N)